MTPTVFAYMVLFTLLLVGAAAAMEWGTRGRGAARHFWTAAIVLAVLAPSGALTLHAFDARTAPGVAAADGPPVLTRIIISSGRAAARRGYSYIARDALIRLIAPSRRAIRAALARIARDFAATALVVWIALSASLVAWLAVGVFHWRRAQRSWERTVVDGVSVDVSAMTGPAVVGFLSHRIVLPSWATTMLPEHRKLVLAHESEHIAARDPERLMLAAVALVFMPWNIGLWWCAARLRRAIELDCDMRVLTRYPSATDYGHVLLEVAARGRNSGPLAVPMVTLPRLPSELELRLRAMTSVRRIGMQSVVTGGVVALIAVAAAFTTPVPTIMSRTAAPLPIAPAWSVRVDTGSKRRIDSLAILRRQNDSLRTGERMMATRMRALQRATNERDSVEAILSAARKNTRALRAVEFRPTGTASRTMTYFSFQVDKPARMLPTTVTPLYPDSLRRARIGGEVDAEFTVDTTGRVDRAAGIKITNATDPLLEQAVRTALPKMTFAPAEIRGKHIRQLVQQPFTFAITKDPQ